MLWQRVVLRPDARLALAALGTAAAILLPLSGTLVLEGLADEPGGRGVLLVARDDPFPLQGLAAGEAVRFGTLDGVEVAAFVRGDARVGPDEAWPMADAGRLPGNLTGLAAPGEPPDLVPAHVVVVHPSLLGEDTAHLAHLAQAPAAVPDGAAVHPAEAGRDAFEALGTAQLRSNAFGLVVVSLPAVALVAAAFADHEARERARNAATLHALGRPRLGHRLVAARILLMVALGAAGAAAAGALLWWQGGAMFHVRPLPVRPLLVAGAAPCVAAVVAGVAWARLRAPNTVRLLRAGAQDRAPPGVRLAFLPPTARPLVVGAGLAGVLMVAGLLFVANLGFPLAASQVPASLAGGDGELVHGAGDGQLVLTGSVDIARADALRHDPALHAILAEILLPTAVEGRPVLLRGGDWQDLASFHGLRLQTGAPPGPDELVLGKRLAATLDAGVGDRVAVSWSDRLGATALAVSGIAAGPDLLEDEGFVATATGQRLAGLDATEATLLRARPDSQAAQAALERTEGRIEVVDMQLDPPQAPAGSLAQLRLDLVNLGASPAQRELVVRVDGAPVDRFTASLGGHGSDEVTRAFIVPDGTYRIAVNPERFGQGSASERAIEVPAIAFANASFSVQLSDGAEGVRVGLWPDRQAVLDGAEPLVAGRTDPDGRASLVPARPGSFTVAAVDDAVVATDLVVGRAGDQTSSRLVVESFWVDGGVARPGVPTAAHVAVRNLGGVAAEESLPVRVRDRDVASLPVTLQPGASTVTSFVLALPHEDARVHVGDRVFQPGPQESEASRARAAAQPVQRSDRLQSELADEALGDAQRVLAGLGVLAFTTSLAIVGLATGRALRGRVHVLEALEAVGVGPARLLRRAAWEATALGGVSFLAAAALGALGFEAAAWFGWPQAFGHHLPNPVSAGFVLQGAAVFAGIAALAATLATQAVLREQRLSRHDALDGVALRRFLGPGPEVRDAPGEEPS